MEALAKPRVRAVLELVADHELPAGQVGAAFPEVSQPTVSQHLRVLREAGLVTERREGTRRLYRANAQALDELRQYMSDLWAASVEQAKSLAERDAPAEGEEPGHDGPQRHREATSGRTAPGSTGPTRRAG